MQPWKLSTPLAHSCGFLLAFRPRASRVLFFFSYIRSRATSETRSRITEERIARPARSSLTCEKHSRIYAYTFVSRVIHRSVIEYQCNELTRMSARVDEHGAFDWWSALVPTSPSVCCRVGDRYATRWSREYVSYPIGHVYRRSWTKLWNRPRNLVWCCNTTMTTFYRTVLNTMA